MLTAVLLFKSNNQYATDRKQVFACAVENRSSGFSTMSDINWTVQPQKIASGLNYYFRK